MFPPFTHPPLKSACYAQLSIRVISDINESSTGHNLALTYNNFL